MSLKAKDYSHDFYTAAKALNLYEVHEHKNSQVFVCVECKQFANEILDVKHGQECGIQKLEAVIDEYENYLTFKSISTY